MPTTGDVTAGCRNSQASATCMRATPRARALDAMATRPSIDLDLAAGRAIPYPENWKRDHLVGFGSCFIWT